MRTLREQVVIFLVTSCLTLTGAIRTAKAQADAGAGQPPAPPAGQPSNGPGIVEEEVVGGPPAAAPGAPAPPPPASGAPPATEEVVAGPKTEGVVTTGKKAMREDIVVTGSRIRRKDLTSTAPLAVFTREQIQQTGRANVGEFLQTLPWQANAVNRGTNNGGTGAIRVNLRGVGVESTLVLLNGRRITPGGSGANTSVDLSALPTNVIERIEILRDGSSAVYGSDAIAGVVNIITRKRLDGMDANVYSSTSTRGDGQQIDVNAVVGTTGEKGGVLLSVGYYQGWPVWAGNRDFSHEQLQYDSKTGKESALGSGTIPQGRVVLGAREAGNPNGNAAWNDLVRANPAATSFIRNPDGTWRPFTSASLPPGGDGWNYQPDNYLLTPQSRFNLFASGDRQLGAHVRAFFDAYYSKRTSAQTLAPEPLNTDGEAVTVSGQNIYNPFGRDFAAVRRRLVEFARRNFDQDINNMHVVAGLDGTLPESWGPLHGWFWEAVGNFSRNDSVDTKTGNLRLPRLRDAVGPSFIGAGGAPQCGTPLNPIASCVPLNLFGGPGSITQDQIQALTYTGVQHGYNQMMAAQFNTSGELFHLFAEQAVGLALGYEIRQVKGGQIPDPITVAGETSGNKSLITEGKYSAHEIYGELSIPIVDKRPGFHALELVAAGRASFYDNFGSTLNGKFGARYAPVQDVTVRGTISTAFRAPNIPELYRGAADAFPSVQDPCASPNIDPNSPLGRNCGAAVGNADDRTQLRSKVGGNAALRPESALIGTVGVVVQPRWVRGLAFTFDYYNTKVEDKIVPLGVNVILQGCYPSGGQAAPKYCEFVGRDPVTQRIDTVTNLNTNAGSDFLQGLDFAGTYDFDTAIGRLGLLLNGTYLATYDRTLPDGTVIKGAGTWDLAVSGVGGAFPHLRGVAAVNWFNNGFSASVRSYYIGGYKECGDASGVMAGGGLCYDPNHVGERQVSPWNSWDLTFGYMFKTTAGRTQLMVGSTNVFDQRPPKVYNGFAATTDTYSYDLVLRQVYARIGQSF
jgi:iron complex outermembrane receptor protein